MKRKTAIWTVSVLAALGLGAATQAQMMGGAHMMGGAQTMGPGMMGGGGQMMGPGMGAMGGMGDQMMGPGMLGGIDLSDAQRKQLADLQVDAEKKRWEIMSQMHAQGMAMHQQQAQQGDFDADAARTAMAAMHGNRMQMFEIGLDYRKRLLAILTDAQRKQIQNGGCPPK